jgi:hypothetical protein
MRVPVRALLSALALVALGATVLWAADPPYAGSWKLNPAKSDFGETTVTYEELSDGQMKATADGQSYTFKVDGKEYSTPWGTSSSWKSIDANTWEVTTKVKEKVVGTATLKVAADGKTLSIAGRNINAAGEASENTAVYQRVSGGAGLAGKWKTENLEIGAPGTMTISPNGADGLTLTFVDEDGSCSAQFGGADAPAKGPIWPDGWTCALAKAGADAFQLTWKKDGKLMYEEKLTVSADGQTLTDVSGAPGAGEQVTVVFDRQE